MAIPKEPRALMIQLMYLVLTAMLALNVSAEIMNAFFALDKGINKTNTILDSAAKSQIEGMQGLADSKKQYQPLVDAAKEAQGITAEFDAYVTSLYDAVIDESGDRNGSNDTGDYDEKTGKPLGKKDKDASNRLFIEGGATAFSGTPQGTALYDKINETRAKYKALVEKVAAVKIKGVKITPEKVAELESAFTLAIDDAYEAKKKKNPKKGDGEVWAMYNFGHMPVSAVMPMLTKTRNDAKTTQAAVVNFFADNMGKLEVTYDKFDVFSSAEKSYILQGDTYNAEIALGAYSSQAKFNVSVNGKSLAVKDGKAKFSQTPGSVGEKTYTAKISVANPLTGDVERVEKKFSYEVGAASAAINLEQMNVFYIGVDNPISISVSGASSNSIKVNGSGVSVSKKSGSKYTVKASKPTNNASITISAPELKKPITFKYRVKRIPDPIAKLGGKETGGKIKSGVFKAMANNGVYAILDNFDFDARCQIQGYDITYVPKRQDPVTFPNPGSKPSGRAGSLVSKAKPGDTFYFQNVKARCPGDKAGRKINPLVFTLR